MWPMWLIELAVRADSLSSGTTAQLILDTYKLVEDMGRYSRLLIIAGLVREYPWSYGIWKAYRVHGLGEKELTELVERLGR